MIALIIAQNQLYLVLTLILNFPQTSLKLGIVELLLNFSYSPHLKGITSAA